MATQARGDRPSILVVEDEFIIALDLSETVQDLGYRVEGPYVSRENAFDAIDRQLPDLAILDVYTADGEVFPLADALTEAGVPIIFHSGHVNASEMRARYPQAQAVCKPCPPDQLIGLLQGALEQPASTRH
jgi:DNA-binding NtrC family response regulator